MKKEEAEARGFKKVPPPHGQLIKSGACAALRGSLLEFQEPPGLHIPGHVWRHLDNNDYVSACFSKSDCDAIAARVKYDPRAR